MGAAEATKLDEEYMELERVRDRSFVIAFGLGSAGRVVQKRWARRREY